MANQWSTEFASELARIAARVTHTYPHMFDADQAVTFAWWALDRPYEDATIWSAHELAVHVDKYNRERYSSSNG